MTRITNVDRADLYGRMFSGWPIRLAAQDAALSRRKHEFESRMGHTRERAQVNPLRRVLCSWGVLATKREVWRETRYCGTDAGD
jgi:hypothetical protein